MPIEHSPPPPVNPLPLASDEQNLLSDNIDDNIPSLPHTPSQGGENFLGFKDWEIATDPATMKELTGLFRQRGQVHRKLIRLNTSFRAGNRFELAILNVMASKLTALYSEFNCIHTKIMAIVPDEAVQEQEEAWDAFEDIHDYLNVAIERMILRSKNVSLPPATAPQVVIQQQPLKAPIPTFDGNYESWPKFKAIFQDLMANSADSDAIKLYHLDKSLVGAATGVLDENIISAGDYQQAWTVLTERYENQRVIVESHIRGLLHVKKMSSESHQELRNLLNECTRHVEGLRFLKHDIIGISEQIIVYVLTNALDKATRKAWEATQRRGELPRYEPTITFLKNRCQILENCESATPDSTVTTPHGTKSKLTSALPRMPFQKSHTASTSSATSVGSTSPEESCDICNGEHLNFQCTVFKKLPAMQRLEKVRAANLCFNCLRKGHRSSSCQSSNTCRKCQKRHHTLLHEDPADKDKVKLEVSSTESEANVLATAHGPVKQIDSESSVNLHPTSSTTFSCNFMQSTKTVLLLTAIVHAIDKHNQPHKCRVLLDSGSQVNFVSEEMASLLGWPKQRADVHITGINALKTLARDKVFIKFRSMHEDFQANLECLIVPKVTGIIPSTKIGITQWNIPSWIPLADPTFNKPGKIDMLVGAELFFDLWKSGKIIIDERLPQLRETYLGWVVSGVVNEGNVPNAATSHSNIASIARVEDMMRKFWEIEEVPYIAPLSDEEQSCESHFLSTTKRDKNGRFVVNLPLKNNLDQLDDCRSLALKRFLMLERRLERNPDLRLQYVDFIREYEKLGHCHEVKNIDEVSNRMVYYMPHHAVLRPTSSSTKCRVVFDASAKSHPSKLSLNEVLKIGPVVQRDLFSIMLSFRKHAIVFSADIKKMYRQILMDPDDTCYQRIFWREQPSHRLRVLELDTITYGTASAPYQATRCLNQLADSESELFPIAARIIKEDCYMDDILSGADNVREAIECQKQLKGLLAKGGFPVHKWCSNSKQFLMNIPQEERETQSALQEQGPNESIKILGILWDPDKDSFLIAHRFEQTKARIATKRIIYSEIAKFFDPLGLFAPVIVVAKLLMQYLWTIKTGWDDLVDEQVQQRWQTLQEALPEINHIKVPRRVIFSTAVAYELHGFGDASDVAYGACIYVRCLFSDGTANLRLLASKSRLAPLHAVTIPRKELCAALLLAQLIEKVLPAMQMKFQQVVCWSDSTIVLSWIKKPYEKLRMFVRNRIAEIQRITKDFKWSYIRSNSNPADIVSRGQLPQELNTNNLWWNGPEFLYIAYYQAENIEEVPEESLPEMKVLVAMPALQIEPFPFFTKFNNFRKIQRIMAYVLRFVKNTQTKDKSERTLRLHPTISELQRSTIAIFKIIQHTQLADEIQRLKSNKVCKRIGNLRPLLVDGLLRVGGRLIHSKLPFATKHHIILPD